MSKFQEYLLSQAEKREAYQQYCHASVHLENAGIKERLSEINSQHEPLNSLIAAQLSERDRLYSAAFYVVVGRMPELQAAKGGE